MVNGIGSYNSYMSYVQTQPARSEPGPAEMFNKLDGDGSGGVSQSELERFAQNISSKTGNSIDTTDAISTYDTDGDGELNEDELRAFVEESGIKPPPPPPPPGGAFMTDIGDAASTTDADSVISAYDTDGDGVLSSEELQSYLDNSDTANFEPLIGQALSAYSMNFGSDGFFTEDALLNFGDFDGYYPVDLSV